MHHKKQMVWCAALAAALALTLAGCGGAGSEEPAPEETPAAESQTAEETAGETVTYINGGATLSVPAEYDPLVIVETPEKDPDGTLFTVTELASREYGEKQHPGEDWGDGWLFSIGRVDENALHEIECYDMSGVYPFAVAGDGSCYVFYSPTDVRFVRESYDIDSESEDWAQWTALNEWAWTVQEGFMADNEGLTPYSRTNTAVDIVLSQLAYTDNEPYTLTYLSFGTLEPGGVDKTPYLSRLLEGVTFEMVDSSETPDGEYVVLELPQSGEQLDFFLSDGNYVREVYDGNEALYRATYSDGVTEAAQIVSDWYEALAEAGAAG